MAGWALSFAAAALLAALFGFGGSPGLATAFGQIVFFVSLIACMVSLVLPTRAVAR